MYNAGNNRVAVADATAQGTVSQTYTHDLLSFYTDLTQEVHQRDANGNLIEDGTFKSFYDYRNHLVRVERKSDGATVGRYEHDALGRRIAKQTAAGRREFAWMQGSVAMELAASGGLLARWHYGVSSGEVAAAFLQDVSDLDGDGSVVDEIAVVPMYNAAHNCEECWGRLARSSRRTITP